MLRVKKLAPAVRLYLASTLMLLSLLFAASTFLPASASITYTQAQQQGSIVPALNGEVVRDGKAVSVDDIKVQPGEIIVWKLRVTNRGNQGVTGVRAEGMIPKGTAFIPSSGTGAGVTVQYSIDGGRTYSARPTIVVDGKTRLAPVSSYTNILFIWEGEISAGSVKTAQYKTRVL